jgi:hypothetical protein
MVGFKNRYAELIWDFSYDSDCGATCGQVAPQFFQAQCQTPNSFLKKPTPDF